MKTLKTPFRIFFVVSMAALVASTPAWVVGAEKRILTKQERIARNYQLAKAFYDGYVNLPRRGYVDAWKAEDWEKGAESYTFDRKGPYVDAKRRWKLIYRVDEPKDWKELARTEYQAIRKILPDWQIVTPFKGFCDEHGCAWQMNAGGHDNAGKYFECNEFEFMWTNEYGRIVKVEWFEDWVNAPDFLARIAGVSPEDVDYEAVGEAYQRIMSEDSK